MADDFGAQLSQWLDEAEKGVLLTDEEQQQLTAAGAEEFADQLKQNTPFDEDKKSGVHLRDSIVYEPGKSVSNDGGTDVGFTFDKAYIARFLNDGTKHNAPTHFFDNAIVSSRNRVLEAMANKYQELKG